MMAGLAEAQSVEQELGYEPPVFAHLPTVLKEGGEKMSKRRGTKQVKWYRDEGFLPDGLFQVLHGHEFPPGRHPELRESKNDAEAEKQRQDEHRAGSDAHQRSGDEINNVC